jgi:hypothetical protein
VNRADKPGSSQNIVTSMNELVICKISGLTPQICELEAEAVAEGFRFLTRLIAIGSLSYEVTGGCPIDSGTLLLKCLTDFFAQ